MSNSDFPVLDFSTPRSISPTDIGAFGRLEGCERFLRLRLHTANFDANWLERAKLRKQAIPPLLTFAGADFEAMVESGLERDGTRVQQLEMRPTSAGAASSGSARASANERLVETARALRNGESVTLSQPTLEVAIGDWLLRGVLDLLRLSRDQKGDLSVLIADIKASRRAKVEHRLQLAFYYRMLETLLGEEEIAVASLRFGVLYRGPQSIEEAAPDARETLENHRRAARETWGLNDYYFEMCDDAPTYLNSLDRLVFGDDSLARDVATRPFEALPFHLEAKCDGCVWSEFCLRDAAQNRDLSLLPYLTSTEKQALRAGGIGNIDDLAALKTPRLERAEPGDPRGWNELEGAPDKREIVARLAGNRQVGARLDELIHRAHAFLKTPTAKSYIPSRGEGTLPFVSADINANIVRIYLDAGLDYVHNRAYLLGARFVAYQGGAPVSARNVTAMTPHSPDGAEVEGELIREFLGRALEVAVEMAVAAKYVDTETGEVKFRAPVHVTFFDRRAQKIWLETLGRHVGAVMESAPIFDFLKQVPSGDSFVTSALDAEARQLKNFPLLAPSLQNLGRLLRFDWGEFAPLFRRGLFDDARTLEESDQWYTARSRFSSQIPLEYAYGAWGELPAPGGHDGGHDDLFRGFRGRTPDELLAFCERRLEAIEHIAGSFRGNSKTTIAPYDLNCLDDFQVQEPTFVDALQCFLQLERLADLGAWKAARHAPPERRMLSGDSLVVRYFDADQTEEARARNARNREVLAQQKAWREHTPKGNFPKEFNTKHLAFGFEARLRIDVSGCDCCLEDALALATFSADDWVWLLERETYDSRLPESERVIFHPTVRQLLTWSKSATVVRAPWIDESGVGWIAVKAEEGRRGDGHAFTFGSKNCVFEDGEVYSLDGNPNDWSGAGCFKQHEQIAEGEPNFVHDLLSGAPVTPAWPDAARAGQARFLAGLKELGAGFFGFEPSKERFIGGYGDAPLLLVQGPPGTGKTYATAFALLARLQGAMAAGLTWRGLISTHTHAAIDVALLDVYGAQQRLRALQAERPAEFAEFFDARLLEVPLFRLQGTKTDWVANPHLRPLWSKKDEAEKHDANSNKADYVEASAALLGARWGIAGATPLGINKVWKDDKDKLPYFNALIVDEASQMNQPLGCLASVANTHDSTLIVVGDPRQMPPITKHQWETESHRVFEGQPAFESLYQAVANRNPPMIRFEESFRLHARMAQFLREAIYQQDGIRYHSNRTQVLPDLAQPDPFSAAVLAPDHPIVLVIHDEAASILENRSESNILRPLLEQLTDADLYALDVKDGLGIVVPHRAQRALLSDERWKVDTVERFQGDQRRVMAFSATESDPLHLLHNGGFLLDPRRLCVSLSRAKEKLILVAAKSVFDLVPLDEETFLNAQLWQKLRHEFCTHELWAGAIGGAQVRVLGSGLG